MTSARLLPPLADMTGPLFGCLGFFLFSLYDASMKYLLGTETVFSALAVTQTVCALSIVLFVLTVKRTYRFLLARTPWVVLIYAILFILEMTSFLYAVRQIPLADLFVIILTGPILTLALARFVLQEKLSRSQIVSVGLGFGGVMVMLQCWHLFEGENFFSYPPLALGSAFLNVLTFCSKNIFIRKYAAKENGYALAFWGAALLAVFCVICHGPSVFTLTPGVWPLGLGAGLLATLGVITLNKAFALGPAGLVAPIQYSQMVWASLLGFLIWHEIPSIPVVVGGFLVVVGGVALTAPYLQNLLQKRLRPSI